MSLLPYELTIAAVYCPPHYDINKNEFEEYFQTLGNKCISSGDHSGKHLDSGLNQEKFQKYF